MHDQNPFRPPEADVNPYVERAPAQGITPGVLDQLRATRPWVKFLSILGFIFCAMMVLAGLGLMASGALTGSLGALAGAAMALAYMLFGALYVMPALYLYRYAASIERLLMSGASGDLEEALLHQKSFWKFFGVMMVVLLVIYAFGIMAAVAIPSFLVGAIE